MLGKVEQAIVDLPAKGGRGVIVPGGYILTAAHCVSWDTEGGMTLGDFYFQEVKTSDGQTLSTSVLAVEPVADIAVLGSVDEQDCAEDADAFEEAITRISPVSLFLGKMRLIDRREWRYGLPVLFFSQNRQWKKATAETTKSYQRGFTMKGVELPRPGDSGGPIVTPAGELAGIVSTGGDMASDQSCDHSSATAPRLLHCLPAWVMKEIRAAQRRQGL